MECGLGGQSVALAYRAGASGDAPICPAVLSGIGSDMRFAGQDVVSIVKGANGAGCGAGLGAGITGFGGCDGLG